MIRVFVLLTTFLIVSNCGSFQYQKTINLEDGTVATVTFETKKTEAGETILVVDYANDADVLKESKVEEDVIQIWHEVKIEAEKRDIEEAVINYRYLTQVEAGKKIYEGLLFSVDRTESGKWSIKKVE